MKKLISRHFGVMNSVVSFKGTTPVNAILAKLTPANAILAKLTPVNITVAFSRLMVIFCLGWASIFIPTISAAVSTVAAPSPKNWSFVTLGEAPVQNGGRIKPLDSFAREVVLFETGSRNYKGWNSLSLLLSWISFPDAWHTHPFIRIGREDVLRQLGLDEKRNYYSPQELFKNSTLLQYAERIGNGTSGSQPPGAPKSSPREQELKSVLDRLTLFHSLVSGQGWLLVPRPAPEAWASLIDHDGEGKLIRSQFIELIKAYQGEDPIQFENASRILKAAIEGEIPGFQESLKSAVVAESIYNRSRPFFWAWVTYLVSALLWISYLFTSEGKKFEERGSKDSEMSMAAGNQISDRPDQSGQSGRSGHSDQSGLSGQSDRLSISNGPVSTSSSVHGRTQFLRKAALFTTVSASVFQIFGIALRCFIAGRPPVTNMYESVIWVSLGVVVFAWILYAIHRQGVILAVATTLAMFGLIAGDSAPAILDPSIHPLVPVLRSNYWLTIHVLTITLGYAAFALTLGLANTTLYHFLKRGAVSKITSLNQLTYRAMQFGVVLIAAGTILGGIWADYSWGRFWGWDPKEVWALITLLAYIVILHGRFTQWVGQFGFAAWSALAFMTVVMAWYGVNFILGVGLHSYGFSTGGTPWVAAFVGIQLAYVAAIAVVHFRRNRVSPKPGF